jgi:TatD DNase family protein
VHCFTGTCDEAKAYLQRGYFLGFTGFICKPDRGADLRNLVLPSIPLERIMIETDAPFMSFIKMKGQRNSEPSHVVGVAKQLSETLNIPLEQVCSVTTATATKFFRLE